MDWGEYLMGFAQHAAEKSKDPSTKVGAVLTRDRVVLCTGFNGLPRGVKDTADRYERPLKYLLVAHAEANCLMTAAREGIHVEGCDLYVTHEPCSGCAKLIAQAGVRKVVVGPGKTNMPAEEFEASRLILSEAEIAVCYRKGAHD